MQTRHSILRFDQDVATVRNEELQHRQVATIASVVHGTEIVDLLRVDQLPSSLNHFFKAVSVDRLEVDPPLGLKLQFFCIALRQAFLDFSDLVADQEFVLADDYLLCLVLDQPGDHR